MKKLGKNHVKITTLSGLIDLVFPCYCRECGKIGTAFCDCCFFDNIAKNPPILRRDEAVKREGFEWILAGGRRRGVLFKMVKEYKYEARRHFSGVIARWIHEGLKRCGILQGCVSEGLRGSGGLRRSQQGSGEKYVLVPLPTIQRHIRERGFDHTKRLCKEIGALTGFPVILALNRGNSAVQVGSDAKTRLENAKGAYKMSSKAVLDLESHYILVDDVWTTGASMRAARGVLEAGLRDLGAKKPKISALVATMNDLSTLDVVDADNRGEDEVDDGVGKEGDD